MNSQDEIDNDLNSLLAEFYNRLSVVDSNIESYSKKAKQERNSKCICGSEKKAKKCCIPNAEKKLTKELNKRNKMFEAIR